MTADKIEKLFDMISGDQAAAAELSGWETLEAFSDRVVALGAERGVDVAASDVVAFVAAQCRRSGVDVTRRADHPPNAAKRATAPRDR